MEEAREASRGLRHEDQPDFVPDSHRYRARSDVESIGTRVLLGRRQFSPQIFMLGQLQ
jgi:hypothetical protein